jgi:uncharacterized protein (TIGR00369 family)
MRAALRVSRWNAKTEAIGAATTTLRSSVLGGRTSRAGIVSEAPVAQTPAVAEDPQEMHERVRASFDRQGLMAHLGARLVAVGPGTCAIACGPRPELSQQHGFVHAGAIAAIADSAAGYAALSLAPAGSEVLTVEFKLNLLAPAAGEVLMARGRVIRPGRTISVCEATVAALRDGEETACAIALVTMIHRGGGDQGS